MKNNLGKKLQDYRQGLDLTQAEFCEPLTINRSLLSHYETGNREIPEEFVEELQRIYGFNLHGEPKETRVITKCCRPMGIWDWFKSLFVCQ